MIHFEKTEADVRREALRGRFAERGLEWSKYGIIAATAFLAGVFSFPYLIPILMEWW
ncbi:hypothetical protein GWO43_30310 [candidate division KSB1 bacterium]|nr:hypothetical protein [candidate division KSB1 bacterium]NIV70652.1 hypothetical protein [Phycisphaerae bacterium]NIS28183.1 hypothetical protein [candidate division KSB1 bacterium]NIT75076.1 hypothetical protein [candidate division KSB1 bacterium]NIU28862.1 hypothetical protein [candidate division KSB1 bacterium]